VLGTIILEYLLDCSELHTVLLTAMGE
jgi:hypothetical protein